MITIDDWLARDNERQIHLVKDSLILTVNSRSQELLNWGIKVLFAKNYIDNLREETKKGQAEKIRQGWLPTKPPLGYITTGDAGHKIHIIDSNTAPFIKDMFELYATSNFSIKKLCTAMYEKGLRTIKGSKVIKSRMHQFLSDPFYCGMLRWNGKVHEGKQTPIISKELFDTVQMILNQKTTPKYRKHITTFKGLLKCEECQGTITWETQKGHWYGHCNHYKNCSLKGYTRQEKVNEQIFKHFDKIAFQNTRLSDWILKGLKESHADKIDYQEKCLNELNTQLKRLQTRADVLYNDRLDGRIDTGTYDRKYKEIADEREGILNTINRHGKAEKDYFDFGANLLELSQNAGAIYKSVNDEKKRELLSLVFSKLVLNADKGMLFATFRKPFEIIAQKVSDMKDGSKLPKTFEKATRNFEPPIFLQQEGTKYPENEVLLPRKDSNLEIALQRRLCYRYTTGQLAGGIFSA